MISQSNILMVLAAHFVGDFLLQSDWMAVNKSKDNVVLLTHVVVYLCVLCFIDLRWAIINGVLHFWTDFVTSRVTSYLWAKEKRHWFFVVIGFDQLIHGACLFTTFPVVGNAP